MAERDVILTEITAKPRPAATLFQERLEKIWLLLMKSMLRSTENKFVKLSKDTIFSSRRRDRSITARILSQFLGTEVAARSPRGEMQALPSGEGGIA